MADAPGGHTQRYLDRMNKRSESSSLIATEKLKVLTEDELEALAKWKDSPSHKALKKYLDLVRKPYLLDGYSKIPVSTASGDSDREVILSIKDLQSRLAEDEYIVDKLVETARKRWKEVKKIKKAKTDNLKS